MDRLGKLNGMIERVHLVRLTIRVSALAEILFYPDGRGLLAINAAIRAPDLSHASTNGKPASVLVVHGKVTSIRGAYGIYLRQENKAPSLS
jgi:hypothetical protein